MKYTHQYYLLARDPNASAIATEMPRTPPRPSCTRSAASRSRPVMKSLTLPGAIGSSARSIRAIAAACWPIAAATPRTATVRGTSARKALYATAAAQSDRLAPRTLRIMPLATANRPDVIRPVDTTGAAMASQHLGRGRGRPTRRPGGLPPPVTDCLPESLEVTQRHDHRSHQEEEQDERDPQEGDQAAGGRTAA